ncbi:alpha/beta fold hydrolase [Chloroflexota bacterium]
MKKASQPSDKYIDVNGLNLHYLEWGNSEATPMLLLHGLCSHAHYWDFFASSIAQDYYVLALDQRGHGDSSWAENYGPRYYVFDLEVFITNLNIRDVTIIGHSMGGINAIIYAALHPDQVKNLIIVDIGPEIGSSGIERMERERFLQPEAFVSQVEVTEYYRRTQPRYSESFVQHLIQYSIKYDDLGRIIFKHDKILQKTTLKSPEWLWDYLGQVICPTLLLHGNESDILPNDIAKRVGSTLPFGTVTDIENSGHSILGDNLESFEATVRKFLNPN